ncbi:hypothetical protein MSG28_013623 [Choristoneura fumiferana]|uniref:Uncharacterized protein n=1 Tax=Choristoneura fumiferana TaxID=7141 RepID=A0ACC0K8C4_CHOFU|nr:hypothetical protein MSG28_013623 [Choristoneura fumiferana]
MHRPSNRSQAESRACITEALVAAAACFEELGRTDVSRHVLLLCSSPPYSAYAGGLVPHGTVELAARLLGSSGVQVSIAAARRLPALLALYEQAGGELALAQQRSYAKDPRHLVLLRGYSLKERPPSPAPPPAPEIQPDIYGSVHSLYRRMPGMLAGPSAAPQRTYIWSGVLEWMEKGKNPGDQQKVTKHLPCQAGCVHFSPMSSPPQCDIKVLILLYTPDKKAYLGFIPNNQATFVDRLRKVSKHIPEVCF